MFLILKEEFEMVTFSGCYTALITPMNHKGQVDYEGLKRLVDFQIENGVKGILAVGTTGESPTLDWNEHTKVIEKVHEYSSNRCLTIAGTGSNSTPVSYTHLRAHETDSYLVCRLLLEKKKKKQI